ncbi:nucleoside transporter C-terminal domain-containing protein [Telmatospirillum sp.]|uniref:NupC/NupG family nucleoside CNT transporter n=1 Tax=Telmatospirillum sp. TaxID=2079197 RepID=UPI00283E88A6|nr:nucleoside transporter C-terminal domain-containing protein [Telmatospirillum sp.]MDR3435397.1 nucleoside transporter C-terminal domain-containing protein [Telmatospirillum sp.]
MTGQGLLGMAGLLAAAWAISEDRHAIPWRTVVSGLALQLALALLLIKVPGTTQVFFLLNHAVEALQKATDAGTGFVFGYLGGGPAPFAEIHASASFILAFRALPLVLTISALSALLFHWGIMQRIVSGFAWLLRRSMGIGGALGLGAAVHIFVGMIEAPLLVRPYLARMTRGELFAIMSCGMAGIAGTMMVIYASILGPVIPNALGNILIASLISTPAALAVSALMVPFVPDDEAGRLSLGKPTDSAMDAIVRGTTDGIGLLVNITAMLLVLVALVTLVNIGLSALPDVAGAAITVQRGLGALFAPVMWGIGMPWDEALIAGTLMGSKTILNEFVAYLDLAALPEGALSPHSRLMVTYALCGFANLGSLGIMIGGLGAMIPERKNEVIHLAAKSIVSGTIATCLSGAVVGLL